jgi:hypothetical protein
MKKTYKFTINYGRIRSDFLSFVCCLVLINILPFICGLFQAHSDWDSHYKIGCFRPGTAPIEYVVPGYKIGCWAGRRE